LRRSAAKSSTIPRCPSVRSLRKPSKKKSIERIDGIVALIMALDRASTQPPPETSVYETRGLLYV